MRGALQAGRLWASEVLLAVAGSKAAAASTASSEGAVDQR